MVSPTAAWMRSMSKTFSYWAERRTFSSWSWLSSLRMVTSWSLATTYWA